jgi:hypothetical protein
MRPTADEQAYGGLPFPIAFHAHRCHSFQAARSPESRARHLAHALEALVRYLALVALSDYLQQGAFAAEVNALLQERIRRRLTLGHWLEVLREVVRAFAAAGRETRPPELAAFLFDRRPAGCKPSPALRLLDRLVGYRNDYSHQWSLDLAGTLDQRCDEFRRVLAGLRFLADYPLVIPTERDPGDPHAVTGMVVCMGHPRDFRFEEARVEVPDECRADVTPPVSPVLPDRAGRRVLLVLYPLQLFEIGLGEELYNYLHSTWSEGRPTGLTFEPNQPQRSPLEIRAHEEREYVLRAFRQRFAALFPDRPAPEAPAPARSFRIPSLEAEVETLARAFVGRRADCDRLHRELGARGQGYLCYEAPAGAGKSAYAAFLVQRFGWPGHLVKRESQRDQPERFLQCLLWKLMNRHGVLDEIPAARGALEEKLYGTLEAVSERLRQRPGGGREVIVLDGLNYLDPDAPAGFLFDTLPAGIFFVLLSRHCRLLEVLRRRVRVDWVDLPLEGLTPEEAREFLGRAEVQLPEGERGRLVRQAAGWPLYLDHAARNARAGRPWGKAAADVDGYYREDVERACAAYPEAAVGEVLGLLYAAREPLRVAALAAIARLPVRQVRGILEQVSPHLLIVEQHVTVFHETFRDYLARELGPETLRRCDEEIIRWSRTPEPSAATP